MISGRQLLPLGVSQHGFQLLREAQRSSFRGLLQLLAESRFSLLNLGRREREVRLSRAVCVPDSQTHSAACLRSPGASSVRAREGAGCGSVGAVSPIPRHTLLLASDHPGLLPRKAAAPWMEHSSREPLKHRTVPQRVSGSSRHQGTDFSHVFLFCFPLLACIK